MTGSVAIDVTIGLVFVYLLYSLFATILCEIIANFLGLRARNLREALIRLLEDEESKSKIKLVSVFQNFGASFQNLFSKPGGGFVQAFYEQATIKYLARNDFYSSPAYISPANFSKALMEIFRDKGKKKGFEQTDLEKVKEVLENQGWIDDKTKKHIASLLDDANGDLVKFRILLERWYDSTMERAIGWYKQKIQVVLLIIGMVLAIAFNADTFHIVKVLAKDDKGREQMVKMAIAYVEQHKDEIKKKDTTRYSEKKLDSLFAIKKQLEQDIASANSILGLGWPPDTVVVIGDSLGFKKEFQKRKEESLKKSKTRFYRAANRNKDTFLVLLPAGWSEGAIRPFVELDCVNDTKVITKANVNKRGFIWDNVKKNFWGYLITAFAISLGSPFWFDLLSKLVQIRGSVQQPVHMKNTTEKNDGKELDPLLIKG